MFFTLETGALLWPFAITSSLVMPFSLESEDTELMTSLTVNLLLAVSCLQFRLQMPPWELIKRWP